MASSWPRLRASTATPTGHPRREVIARGMWIALAATAVLVVHAWLHVPYDEALFAVILLSLSGAAVAWRLRGRRVPWRLVALRAALVAAAIVLGATSAEYVARFAYRNVRSSADFRSYFARRGPTVATNSMGFRDHEVASKAPDRYRIVVIGDSITWGQGLDERERFTNLIEGFLGPRYEVLNFAIPGDNLREHLIMLERALGVAPDYVLLQLYVNDFETPGMFRPRARPVLPWRGWDEQLIRSSVLYDLLSNRWVQFQEAAGLTESYPAYMKRELGDPGSPHARQAFGMFRQFFERAHSAGVAAGAVMFPYPSDLGKDYPLDFLHDRIRDTCADERVDCLDLRPAFSSLGNPRRLWVSPFDSHPNAKANARAAAAIVNEFGVTWRQ